ncbi:MAG: DHHW family protein [Erysipelotrichaceae bacterium]|nr:DHHW family protein [Erysipelotrichaceae bacterium]
MFKKHPLTAVISLLAVLILMFDFLGPTRVFSTYENRYLTQRPSLKWEDIVDGKWMLTYEEFINDQFMFRDGWISLKSLSERILMKKENNGILFGKEGYLFEKLLELNEQTSLNLRYLAEFEKLVTAPLTSMIIPNSYAILPQYLPKGSPLLDQLLLIEKWDRSLNLLRIESQLLNNNQNQLYYKNDHHWTLEGAYVAYTMLCEQWNIQPLPYESFSIEYTPDFLGTYYAKAKPSKIIPDRLAFIDPKIQAYRIGDQTFSSIIDRTKLSTHDKYGAFLHGNIGLSTVIVNETEKPTRLLVIKDSYANSLIPFLVSHFDEVVIVDLRHFSGSLSTVMQTNSFDQILFIQNFSNFISDAHLAKLRY